VKIPLNFLIQINFKAHSIDLLNLNLHILKLVLYILIRKFMVNRSFILNYISRCSIIEHFMKIKIVLSYQIKESLSIGLIEGKIVQIIKKEKIINRFKYKGERKLARSIIQGPMHDIIPGFV
jgi:hypothetical protein